MPMPSSVQLEAASRMGRTLRRPQHTFHLRTYPWQIMPFFIAPVLPGETMKNLLLQTRVVTDPIKNPLIGWWHEQYFFYVKHRDLAQRDELTNMMLDPLEDLSTLESAANPTRYHFGGAPDYTSWCLERVIEEYFRNDGEGVWDHLIADTPIAAAHSKRASWLDSVTLKDTYTVHDPNVDVNADTVIKASEVERAMAMWYQARNAGMVEMDYEDYLATYGVKTDAVELHVPELVRYFRQWSYPVNHVEPTTGAPTSAVSWAISGRADKDRYFREPGFLFGVCVTRPKVYLRNLDGSAVDQLRDAMSWLPALLAGMPEHSIRTIPPTEGPLQTVVAEAVGYTVDLRDLFLYGDQFVNFPLSATDINCVSLPNAALSNKFYASAADAAALFVDPLKQYIRQDGVVSLSIAGQQRDVT